jgi:hypothetical protein
MEERGHVCEGEFAFGVDDPSWGLLVAMRQAQKTAMISPGGFYDLGMAQDSSMGWVSKALTVSMEDEALEEWEGSSGRRRTG